MARFTELGERYAVAAIVEELQAPSASGRLRAAVPVMVRHCLAKKTSGSLRPFGYRKSVTVSRLSPQAK
jgi:hypothetical protein